MRLDSPRPAPQPSATSGIEEKEARWWAMACHLSCLLGYLIPVPFVGIIAPVVVWQIKRDKHAMIDDHGREAVNFQISVLIYAVVCGLLMIVFIGMILLPLLLVVSLILVIIAGLKASNGESYRYPMTIRFLK